MTPEQYRQQFAFIEACAENPLEPGRLRQYADWLREIGDEPAGHAVEWMAARKQSPYCRSDRKQQKWVWIRGGSIIHMPQSAKRLKKVAPHAVLHPSLFDPRRQYSGGWVNSYRSWIEATWALALSLKELGELWRILR